MTAFATRFGSLSAAFVAALFLCVAPLAAASVDMDGLYAELADPDNPAWERAQADILREWSKSGSATMDLLLKRGKDAMEAGDLPAAIEHLTALTDHAPDFAEGWNARATAYFMAGEFGPSLADIRKTLALNPHHFGALTGLGTILEQSGQPEEAMRAFRAALALNPHQENVTQALERLEKDAIGVDI
jgi:Flp pilus assembly protein TadD